VNFPTKQVERQKTQQEEITQLLSSNTAKPVAADTVKVRTEKQ